MTVMNGTVRSGIIVPDAPDKLPEGKRVKIAFDDLEFGMTDEDWPTTPEGIEALIRRMDSAPVVELTPEEEQEWNAARQAIKEYTLKKMRERVDLE